MSGAHVKLDLIENDRGPVGLRKYPASQYPRRMATASIPVKGLVVGTLTLPQPMTSREWALFLAFVEWARGVYVEETT